MTRVVHCKREKYDVLIDRTTIYGNPFKIGKDGTREEVIAKFKEWINYDCHALLRTEIKRNLKGKVLGCWCKTEKEPNRPCHGDILAEIADGDDERL